MATVILSLGSNVGNRHFYMKEMLRRIKEIPVTKLILSSLMETEPVGITGKQDLYLNQIVRGFFSGTPQSLFLECQRIEKDLGRTEKGNCAPRTADIDILFFGHDVIKTLNLIVPHPKIRERKFCLEGLKQIAPYWKFPDTGLTAGKHFKCMDQHTKNQSVTFLHPKVKES